MPSEGETAPLLGAQANPDPNNHNDGTTTVAAEEDAGGGGGSSSSFSKTLGTAEAFAIVISIVIGSGVFTSPGSIDTNVPSPAAALVVWLVGGVLAWTGASTLAELGTAIPGEGEGFYHFSITFFLKKNNLYFYLFICLNYMRRASD